MPIKTKRWNDNAEPDDGFRLLICRYRPRALKKADETWDAWWKDLGPSKELHADFYGKHGPPIDWKAYRGRYLQEMKAQKEKIAELAKRVAAGETLTLLCSSACVDPDHCHRTLLKRLIEKEKLPGKGATD
jgi:uncharacterized protein YeaO (DUF488 family)